MAERVDEPIAVIVLVHDNADDLAGIILENEHFAVDAFGILEPTRWRRERTPGRRSRIAVQDAHTRTAPAPQRQQRSAGRRNVTA